MAESALFEVPVISAEEAARMLGLPVMTTMKWATYRFCLRGLSPLMLDRMTARQVKGLVTGEKVDYSKDEGLDIKASRKMYSDSYENDMPAGAIGIPADNLYACLRDAGEAVQFGSGKHDKVTMATKGTMLFYMVNLRADFFPILGLDGKPAEWKVDLRKGNATQGTGAVGIVRGRFDEWGIVGHLDLNVNALSEPKLRELIGVAGVKQGLCSARPGNKMRFGQFSLTELTWIGGAEPNSATAIASTGEEPAKPSKPGRKPKNRLTAASNGELELPPTSEDGKE